MTDNQDSVTAGAVQPPTDRPLTTGDVFHFHESRMIADMTPVTAVWVDDCGVLYEREDGERKWENHSPDHDITFVERQAASGSGDWIEWHGGENPVPGQMVEVDFRDGSGETHVKSDELRWDHPCDDDDIVAYRLARPATSAASEGEGVAKIVSDEEVARVHGNANFGATSPREVVNEGVRKTAVGYHCGSTMLSILREHGLITKPRPGTSDCDLTKKGKAYGRALWPALASPPVSERERELEAEVTRLRDVLLGIAESDHYRRYPKQHEDGGIRGQSGLRAVRALTGKHGSYINDDEVRALDAEQRRDLTAQPAGEGK